MAEICVVGAGPAGSTYAARMAQLGYDVSLIEAARFPRAHLGESLSPGVLPLLEGTGVRAAVESAGFCSAGNVQVQWESAPRVREQSPEQSLLVDRGEFDRLLLEHARELGVRVRQPARVVGMDREGERWNIVIEANSAREQLSADFVADASGRAAVSRPARQQTGCRTVALYAYWRGENLPREPRIEAGADAWFWGVPLPGGSYNTMVFVDVNHFREAPEATVTQRFLNLLGPSGLSSGLERAYLDGPVRTADASPWLDPRSVTPSRIRLGEAALAIDPISSSGVQKAIQSGLAAAIVSNTLLCRPALSGAAIQFYQSSLQEASARHNRWAAQHYGKVAAMRGGRFWRDRAAGAPPADPVPPPPGPLDPQTLAAMRVSRSPQLEFVSTPCLDGDFVSLMPALLHPRLETPVAWVGNYAVAPLLQRMETPATVLQLAISWSGQVPLSSGIAIAAWMVRHGILVGIPALSRA